MSSFEKYQKNRLFILGGKLGDVMILSLLWLLCSLPVVTAGAATSALYFSVVKCLREKTEDSPRECFFRSFRGCLKQGIAASLIYMVFGGFVAADIYVALNGIGGFTLPEFYKPVAFALVLPIVFTLFFVFPYIGRFSNDLKTIFKNSFLLSAMHVPHVIGLLLLTAAAMLVTVIFPPFVTVTPALCALLGSKMIEADFAQALKPAETADDDAPEEEPSADTSEEEEN